KSWQARKITTAQTSVACARNGRETATGLKAGCAGFARLLEGDQGRLGHCVGRRLGHLQPLRAVHALGDPPVDLEEELVDEAVRPPLLQAAAGRVQEAAARAAGDAEVGVARLAGAVDRAAEHGDLEMLWVGGEPVLDLLRENLHPDV